MYSEVRERHNIPHFHARYGEYQATYAIATGDVLAGSLPRVQHRVVQAWVELRRSELEVAWVVLVSGRSPRKIDPIK